MGQYDEDQTGVGEEDKLLYKISEGQIDMEFYSVQTRMVTYRRIAFNNLEEYKLFAYNKLIDRFYLTSEGDDAYHMGYHKYDKMKEKQKEETNFIERERRLTETRLEHQETIASNRAWYIKLGDGIKWLLENAVVPLIITVMGAVIIYLLLERMGWK